MRALLILALPACAHLQPYAPAPLEAPRPSAFAQRTLADTGLRAFLAGHGAPVHDSAWTSTQLALASLYLHSSITEAAADVAVAEAAEITAGVPPEWTVSSEISRASQVDEGKSTPWSYSLAAGLTLETGGKRTARRTRARAASALARLQLEASAWQLFSATQRAAALAAGADQDMIDAESERTGLTQVASLVRARYAEGRVSLVDVAQAEQEARVGTLAVVQAARHRSDTRLELARALAVPLRAVDSLRLDVSSPVGCSREGVSFDSLGAGALRRRFDVNAAVAAYAVAEADLRLEIARQYPDFTIGPGIAWDEGVFRWLVSLGTPGILRGLNRGPIAEARARRTREAVRLERVQDSVLVGVDSAVVACRYAGTEIAVATSAERSAAEALRLTQAAYDRGETGRTAVALARLALVRATRSVHLARQHAGESAAALDAVLGGWPGTTPRWPDLMALFRARRTTAVPDPRSR